MNEGKKIGIIAKKGVQCLAFCGFEVFRREK